MIDKTVTSVAEALSGITDGMTLLLGGFGAVGQATHLIEGVLETGVRDLVVVANNAGYGQVGLARLLKEGRIRKLICSYPRIVGSTIFEEVYKAGRLELELVPQGTLAERMRAAGAGIPAFYTPTGAGTKLAAGKEVREFGGRQHVLEQALPGDVALVEAWQADRWGNLTYKDASRNFNPVCAMAAGLTIAQAQHLEPLGTLDPEVIVTPGIFVNRVVHIEYGAPRL
ncbi:MULTISPECIES: 3-oxoacid CoA-transferase subunit A [unclassified Paracoccus (in: a-proteobacteria)]|uniref:3-oxoacid CoA-transferase subunit A n=1 Tax=unclassified Paracoccus (in: a-proteobacteria) TaxID=2688777 RepID=UPI001602BE71|nr:MULTISPECIES: 3-oxoacid CoA-transferase subunit A [unclassified Paracoccus (in: a-proteobacteria)]MBB1492316.1 3-oxoacid CoA-transferase subunit A [Paracoccus sp. MC1854]MBB1498451.1 3-oxoacid CoA-transferase subunit A [Paracoccus sp. MC1862]QQO46686.1 3-oxoacid CoA-transferase subunit A [Paracoccus sp. MC1862]